MIVVSSCKHPNCGEAAHTTYTATAIPVAAMVTDGTLPALASLTTGASTAPRSHELASPP